MKTSFSMFLIIFATVAISAEATGSSISGNISYTGASTGPITIVAVTDTTSRGTAAAVVTIASPGVYTLTGLSGGTYYILSTMTSASLDDVKLTDPWGCYGPQGKVTSLVIGADSSVTGINMVLADGSKDYPNPFYRETIQPTSTTQLPDITKPGVDPAIVYDGSRVYLFKHDSSGAASGKVYKIDPYSGQVETTYILALESSPNRICWISRVSFFKGDFWAVGGYGDPAGSGYVNGIFKINLATSNSSNQIPASSGIDLTNELGGLANDGVNFYVGANLKGAVTDPGIIKFNPSQVTEIPAAPFFPLSARPEYLSFGEGCLWTGADADSVRKIDSANGNVLASYDLPTGSAELYFDKMFWKYDEGDNTLQAFSIATVNSTKEFGTQTPSTYTLSQNYPNPFNPSTTLKFGLPEASNVAIVLYDIAGRKARTLLEGELGAGNHSIVFSPENLASGVYFYRMVATQKGGGVFISTKKMILIK
ncbi:MAG: T9SS type A sorting domain-containing protein [Bacteroidota bacterium]